MASATRPPAAQRAARVSYTGFEVAVRAVERIAESFVRVTLHGEELANLHAAGYDQRVKLAFPIEETGVLYFPSGTDDWYARWRALPACDRCPLRTYTIRASRPESNEIDIDFVVHGDAGPATRWARRAVPGDRLVVIGPDARSIHPESGDRIAGVEWNPGTAERVLLAGDETAAPAICSILEALPRKARGQAFIEVAHRSDVLEVRTPGGLTVNWLVRDERPGLERGAALEQAVRAWASEMLPILPDHGDASFDSPTRLGTAAEHGSADVGGAAANRERGSEFEDSPDGEAQREPADSALPGETAQLWDVPDVPSQHDLYAWIAGEAGCIRRLRRFLVNRAGMRREDVAFMGYWRHGRAEG